MAFISGYDTHNECPKCKARLEMHWSSIPLAVLYTHPPNEMVEINGYPAPCDNNGKKLKPEDTEAVSCPIIHRDRVEF